MKISEDMMRKLLAFFFSLWASIAAANVPCTLPFNLQNNTVADATQVMANYNALVTCLGNAAAAGINSDITQLLGLTSPLSVSAGGTSFWIGGQSSGSANAQVVSTSPTGFTLTAGYKVSFLVGVGNTGATTLNVNGTGVVPLLRRTTVGVVPLVGGELVLNYRVAAEFDGTNYQLIGTPPVIVGSMFDFGGPTCPVGTLSANFQAVGRTGQWSSLFTALGSIWGAGDGVTTFNVPDLRNRATYGQDFNVGGLSNRITVAGGNFDGTVLANVGGLQNSNATGAHVHAITDPGHAHAFTASNFTVTSATNQAGFTTTNPGGALVGSSVMQSATTGITVNSTGATYTILAPAAIVQKCVQG